jgi:hypothetical protein
MRFQIAEPFIKLCSLPPSQELTDPNCRCCDASHDGKRYWRGRRCYSSTESRNG